jgi:hypothetical protein
MRNDRDMLLRLAYNRRKRLTASGRPVFMLTPDEVERSTRAAMRLAQASKSQVDQRLAESCVAAAA